MCNILKLLVISIFPVMIGCGGPETDKPGTFDNNNHNNSPSEGVQQQVPMEDKIFISINGLKISATLVENSTTKALLEKLSAGSVTYVADDYGNFEKVGDLPWTLPRNDENITTQPGDLILFMGKSISIYYDTNQWTLTRLGKIDNKTQRELKEFLNAGKGTVTITLSLK